MRIEQQHCGTPLQVFLSVFLLALLSSCHTVKGPISGKTYIYQPGRAYPDAYMREIAEKFIAEHPDLPEFRKEQIRTRQVGVGMTPEMVRTVVSDPWIEIYRSGGVTGPREHWVIDWGTGGRGWHLFFEDGALTSWSD